MKDISRLNLNGLSASNDQIGLIPPYKALLFLWFLSCLLALLGLGDLPLRDFDESTVARVAFEISNSNNLERLLPTLWSEPYLNKAPGLHWIIAALINLTQPDIHHNSHLPSEFIVRLGPAIISTFVIPFGGLLQWHLRPRDPAASVLTSVILLTLLPIARHGRLAMLDGSQLSAIALFWLLIVIAKNNPSYKLAWLGAGLSGSCLLLLKAPMFIPVSLAAALPILFEKPLANRSLTSWVAPLILGISPGISWHIWHAISRGSNSFWLWGGDGALRVLFDSGEGGDMGVFVPISEFFEGGWPWLLLFPLGLLFAWAERNSSWGRWVLSTNLILLLAILPLKTQLPWYSHPLWLPFALACSRPFSSLVRGTSYGMPFFKRYLACLPYLWISIGALLSLLAFSSYLGLLPEFSLYKNIFLCAGIGWLAGGVCLISNIKKERIIGVITLLLGSYFALLLLMSSDLWLWELNESWSVNNVVDMIPKNNSYQVFIEKGSDRPSLSWYLGQPVKTTDKIEENGLTLFRKSDLLKELALRRDCRLLGQNEEWSLALCHKE